MESKITKRPDQSEFSLKELVDVLWRRRLLIASSTILATLIAGIAAWTMPKTYQAGVVISPVSENSGGQLSGIGSSLGQLAGLASLAGLSTGGDSKKAESLAVLQSEALTEKYIRDNNLLPILFQDKWDSSTAKWKVSDPGKVPTVWKANEFIRDHVRLVVTSPKTSIVTLTISWRDPYLAAKWANDLVDVANDYLRVNAINQSERNIAYLTEQASKTDAVGVKQAIYQILQSEINKAMLARGSEEYAFRVLDRAVPPERPSSPRKSLWLLGGFVAGFGISTLIVLIRVTRLY
jgi:uncharacterized protein involved in exopolysaccharide biosynthesis